jgi:hypothetical protein
MEVPPKNKHGIPVYNSPTYINHRKYGFKLYGEVPKGNGHLFDREFKERARDDLRQALKKGEVKVSPYCQKCRTFTVDVTAHHYDYRFPRRVIWLCEPCHRKVDGL